MTAEYYTTPRINNMKKWQLRNAVQTLRDLAMRHSEENTRQAQTIISQRLDHARINKRNDDLQAQIQKLYALLDERDGEINNLRKELDTLNYLSVTCIICKASAGEKCKDIFTHEETDVHATRIETWGWVNNSK